MGAMGFIIGQWQRLAIYALLAVILLGGAAGWGYHKGVQRLWDYQAEQARETVKVVVKQGQATERVVTRYVRVQGETRVVTETIEKEIPTYVVQNPGLCLDPGWRRLHDSAAANAIPAAPGATDAEAAAPSAAAALETVTGNYGAHHRCADQLEALQEWLLAQAAVR